MLYGNVVFVKKSGDDGSKFPVTRKSLKIGRSAECVIRIQNPDVSPQHCHLTIDRNGQAKIRNLSKHTPTFLNDVPLGKGDYVMHQCDMLKIGDRYARWEYNPFSKYINPEHSEVDKTPSSALQKKKSEGAVAVTSKARRVDKRRHSEAGTSLGSLGSLGETLKISLGSTKMVAKHSLDLQKLGLCPRVKIKRCSILASPVPTVAGRSGTPIRTSETWEVKPMTSEQKEKSVPKDGTGRKNTPIKKPMGGQPVVKNKCQAPNLGPIPESPPLNRKTSLVKIKLDDVPECATPQGPAKSSIETLAGSSKKRGRQSITSIPSGILSTPMEKKRLKSSPRYSSSVKKGKINKTEKTPESQGNKRKLSAAATAERAAKKLKTIKPAKPDKNKKAALLVLGKASSKYKIFRKPNIALKQLRKNKKGVAKQISAKYNNKEKTKPVKKSTKKKEKDLKAKSRRIIKERSIITSGKKVVGTGKNNENDLTVLSPGKSLKSPVVILRKLKNSGRISNRSGIATPEEIIGEDKITTPSTSKKNVSISEKEVSSRRSPRGQMNVSGGSSLELNEMRTPDVTLDWFVSPLVVLNSPESSRKAEQERQSTVERVLRKKRENRRKSQTLGNTRGARRLLTTPKQRKSPRNDLTDVRGVKKLMESPRRQKSPRNDLTDVRGVKKLMESPRRRKSPRNDLTDVRGVKKLMESPRRQKSPRNDLTDVRGVKKLMESPRRRKSPRNDLTDVRGVRSLMTTPRRQKSPKNDLTDVKGVRRLMESPKTRKSPRNDLKDVRGVRRLLGTPKQQKAPKNDLTDVEGVSELFATTEDGGEVGVSTTKTGEVVPSAVQRPITRMSTRRTKNTMPAEPEKESPIVRRSTRRTGTLNVDEKVHGKMGKTERKITKKPSEKIAKKENVKKVEMVTGVVTRSASNVVDKRGVRRK